MLLEIKPGDRVGDFVIGMPIGNVILLLQEKLSEIAKIQLKYDNEEPNSCDVLIDLPEDGILLRIEPIYQRLKAIEIYDVQKVELIYSKHVFCSPNVLPTFVNVYSRFGPSYPGKFEKALYVLRYPGIVFTFPIPEKYQEIYMEDEKEGMPLEFSDGTTPIVQRISVFKGDSIEDAVLPPLPENSIYFEPINVLVGKGLLFENRESALISFGMSPQDVLSLLGTPDEVFFKNEDKMRIHSGEPSLGCSDYIYNYYSMGIDIIFGLGTQHYIKKFVLHTNFLMHQNFNHYTRCNFKICTEFEGNILTITPNSKWDEISNIPKFSNALDKPVINDKSANDNPFGSTHFYGFKDVIFEVMHNGHICSVCLFQSL